MGTFIATIMLLLATKTSLGYRRSFIRMTSTTTSTVSSLFSRSDEAVKLLSDVTDIIRSTGFKAGLTRTIQASQVVSKLVREYASDAKAFQGNDGRISPPRVIRKLFEGLGATYVKLGQFIASSPTLFPKEYVLEFQSCLDSAPTVPYSVIREIIIQDLKKPISSVFSYIDPKPLASASIAQVHRGRLLDGTDVVVKVRKPAVQEVLQADLGFIYVTSKLIEFINPSLTRLSLGDIVGDLRESMLGELDFRKEAANLDSFRRFLDSNGITDATAPKPFHQASSSRVLTMEFLKGVPLADLEGIRKYTSNPEETLIAALRTWAKSAAEHDFFHADVHAGNLMVLEDGRVGFIDFGIVGTLSEKVVKAMEESVAAFARRDFYEVAAALSRMGATMKTTELDIEKFGRELEDVATRMATIQPEVIIRSTIDGSAVSAQLSVDERETAQLALDIVKVAEDNGLKLPREFGLLLKQSLYFDRYLKLLAPTLDPFTDFRMRSSDYDPSTDGPKAPGEGRVIDVDVISIK